MTQGELNVEEHKMSDSPLVSGTLATSPQS